MPKGEPAYLFSALPQPLKARWVAHSLALLDSYRDRTGAELAPRGGTPEEEAERLFAAPFVVVSHGAEPDPMLDYGNAAALALWEMTPQGLLRTASRLTAEPELRLAREKLLAEVTQDGFVSGYVGVRISAAGRRFRIEDATIWNLCDPEGRKLGQGASFAHWTPLGDRAGQR